MDQGFVNIKYNVDYSELIKARNIVRDTLSDFSRQTNAARQALSGIAVATDGSLVNTSAKVKKVLLEQVDAHLKTREIFQKADQAQLQGHLRYEDLKKEYSKKSINEIRDAIMRSEEATRSLRAARYEEIKKGEKEVAKVIQQRINEESAGLQMLRSLEKERIGRTFTEQLENNFRSSSVINNFTNIKQQFASMREVMSAPMPTGGGLMGNLTGFASKAVPIAAGAVAVGTALKGIIDIGGTFEDAKLDLQAITGLDDKQTESLSNKARQLAKEWGVDAPNGVEAFKLAISALGPSIAKDQDAVSSMGVSIMTLAKASGTDAAEATRALTTTLSQFGYNTLAPKEQAREMSRIMNVLAAAAQQGNAEIPDLSASMKEVGTIAAQKKISVEGAAAAIEVLSMNSIKGSEAGTGYRNVLTMMSSGSKEAEAALAGMGISFKDINPEVVGQQKAFEVLHARIAAIKDPTERAAAMQKIFGRENIAVANILLTNTKQLGEMEKAITGTSVAQEQANIKMKGMGETWNRIKSIVKDLGITLFEALRPAIMAVLSVFESLGPALGVVADILGGALSVSFKIAFWPIKAFWDITTALTSAFGKLLSWLGETTGITRVVVGAFNWLKTAVQDVWQWIVDKYNDARALLNDLTLGALGTSREDINKENAPDATTPPATADPVVPLADPNAPPVPPPSDGGKGKGKSKAEILRDEYSARKAVLDQALEKEMTLLNRKAAEGQLTEQEFRDEKILKEKAHYASLIGLEDKYFQLYAKVDKSESEKHALEREKAYTKIAELSRDQRENGIKDLSSSLDTELATLKLYNSESLSELELRNESGVLTERDYGKLKSSIQEEYLRAQIETYKDYAVQFKDVDDKKYAQAIASQAEAEKALALLRATTAKKERDDAIRDKRDLEDRKIALMKDGIDKQIAQEELRYQRELELAKNNAALKELVEQQHQANLSNINKQAEDKRLQEVGKGVDLFAGFWQKGYYQRLDYARSSIESEILHVDQGFLRQRGLLKGFLVQWLKERVTAYIADTTAHTTAEGSKTAATNQGVIARAAMLAVEIAKSLAAAAASIATAMAAAWAWLVSTLGPFGIAAAIAATATIAWQWGNIKKSLGFAEGGPVRGKGGPKDDAIPAWLSNGEYVLDAETTQYIGTDRLDSLRRSKGRGFPFLSTGGMLEDIWDESLRIGKYVSGRAPGDEGNRDRILKIGTLINSILHGTYNAINTAFSSSLGSVVQSVPSLSTAGGLGMVVQNVASREIINGLNNDAVVLELKNVVKKIEEIDNFILMDQRKNIVSQNQEKNIQKKRRYN